MAIRFKNRKNKLLALFMAMMMASGTAAMAACNDGDDSSSSDDTTTDSTVVETDTSRINNGSFEFVNWNNGKNLIVNSPTGWSRSTNSASSGTAVSSKSLSGIINTDDDAWDNFTKSALPEGTAAPKTADEARALWSQMSAYDKLAFYKAWDEADYDEDVSKQDFYDSAKDKFNVDIDDVPVYKDYKETDTTKQIKPIANPGTHSGTEDDNVLMIHNAYTNGVGTAQKYTSSSTITLQAGTSAKVSLWVKTSNLTYDDGKEVLNERGAYIGITHTVGGKTLDQMQVKNINTEAMENTSGWDIQFNQSEYEGEQGCVFWDIPITYNLQARFMHGYVSEFEFGQVNNTNEDGWSGSIELNMKANMEKFQEGWRNCTHSVLQDAQIEAMNQMASSPGGSVTENDYQIIEPLYWNGNLTCLNFPLKADSMDEEQPQIVFTGSLASGSYTYDQGGEMSGVYAVKYGLQNIYTWRNTDRVKIDRDGLTHSFTVYTHSTSYGVLRDGGDTVLIEHGDLFIYELIIQRSEAKMIIDLTKPLGYATN